MATMMSEGGEVMARYIVAVQLWSAGTVEVVVESATRSGAIDAAEAKVPAGDVRGMRVIGELAKGGE